MYDAEGTIALQHDVTAPANDHFADFRLAVAAKRHILIRVDNDGFNFRTQQFKFSCIGNGQAFCIHGADFRMCAVCKDQPLRRERADVLYISGNVKVALCPARRGQRFLIVNDRAEYVRQNVLQLFRRHGVLRCDVRFQIGPFLQCRQRIFRTLAQQTADVFCRILPRFCALNNGLRRFVRLRECRKRNSRQEKREAQQQRNNIPAGADQLPSHLLSSCSAGRFTTENGTDFPHRFLYM